MYGLTSYKEMRQFHEDRLTSILGEADPNKKYRNTIVRGLNDKTRLFYKYKSKYKNNKQR